MSNQFQIFDCLKSIAMKAVGGAALITVAIIATPIVLGAAMFQFLLTITDKETRKQPAPEQPITPPLVVSPPEPTSKEVDQQRINEALWFQFQKQYSPVKSWQQQILESIPPKPLQLVVEEQTETEPERSLPSEAIISTPEFPQMPEDLNDKKKWPVRKLQDFCRELNAIQEQRNPGNPKITGYASKGTNQKHIVKLIKKFYDKEQPSLL